MLATIRGKKKSRNIKKMLSTIDGVDTLAPWVSKQSKNKQKAVSFSSASNPSVSKSPKT
jgi:hypothetical protein